MILISKDSTTLGQYIQEYRINVAKMTIADFSSINRIDKLTLQKIEENQNAPRESILKISFFSKLNFTQYGYPTLETAQSIGERIELNRIQKGLTRQRLALLSYISREALRYIELGIYPPTRDKVRLIAEGLRVPPTKIDSSFNLDNWTLFDYINYFRRLKGLNVENLSREIGISKHKLLSCKTEQPNLTETEYHILVDYFQSDELKKVIKNRYGSKEVKSLSYYRKQTGLTNRQFITDYHFTETEIRYYDKGTKDPSLYYISTVCDLNHIPIKPFVSQITFAQLSEYYRTKNGILIKDLSKMIGTQPREITTIELERESNRPKVLYAREQIRELIKKDYEQNPQDQVYRMWFEQEAKQAG